MTLDSACSVAEDMEKNPEKQKKTELLRSEVESELLKQTIEL